MQIYNFFTYFITIQKGNRAIIHFLTLKTKDNPQSGGCLAPDCGIIKCIWKFL